MSASEITITESLQFIVHIVRVIITALSNTVNDNYVKLYKIIPLNLLFSETFTLNSSQFSINDKLIYFEI